MVDTSTQHTDPGTNDASLTATLDAFPLCGHIYEREIDGTRRYTPTTKLCAPRDNEWQFNGVEQLEGVLTVPSVADTSVVPPAA